MIKYFLSTTLAFVLFYGHQVQAGFTYAHETEKMITSYGNFDDGPSAMATKGTDENFEAFKLDEVNFDFDRSSLNRKESNGTIVRITTKGADYNKAVLDRFAGFMKSHPYTDAHIVGYTDIRGSHTYNKGLAERRSNMVIKYLVEQGVDPNRLHPVSVGEDVVKYSNHGDNRHVDINLQD